jgi:hypothetical protein
MGLEPGLSTESAVLVPSSFSRNCQGQKNLQKQKPTHLVPTGEGPRDGVPRGQQRARGRRTAPGNCSALWPFGPGRPLLGTGWANPTPGSQSGVSCPGFLGSNPLGGTQNPQGSKLGFSGESNPGSGAASSGHHSL